MNIVRCVPSEVLKPFIKQYVFIETVSEAANYVVPDGHLVLAFRYKGAISVQENNTLTTLPQVVVSGIRKTARTIHYAQNTSNLLVVFTYSGAALFFKDPLHLLMGQSIEASNLFGYAPINNLSEQIEAATAHQDKINLIERFLFNRLKNNTPDTLVAEAIKQLTYTNGNLSINQLAFSMNLSSDAFTKRFRKSVGATPKQLATILRVQFSIKNFSLEKSLIQIALEAGYFDQAHFINDFKLYTGKTPMQFFTQGNYW